MSRIVLDTDVASTILRRRDDPRIVRHMNDNVMAVTFVTIGELTKWTFVRDWGMSRKQDLERFLNSMAMLPYHREIAQRWGRLQAAAQLRGRPRPVNDTWIAACCISHEVPLLTFNTKDYLDFAEHDGLELLS